MMKLNIQLLQNTVSDYYNQVVQKQQTGPNTDSGLDLVALLDVIVPKNTISVKIPLGIACEPVFEDNKPRGYTLYPRSSTGSKTPLRLSNGTGIIDFGYRGEITACVDNVSSQDYTITAGQRLFQLCAPDLSPIDIQILDSLTASARQAGGYGSTGV